MTWFSPYIQNDNIVDIYTYPQRATVYPNFIAPYPNGLNARNYTLNETVTIDGVTVDYAADFSGATISPRLLGSDGGMYCDNNRCKIDCPNWPYCKAFFHYSSPGCQTLDSGCACLNASNMSTVFIGFAPDGTLTYPTALINPLDEAKAKYWNDPNLWFNVFSNGMVLIKNDGPAYGEIGGEEYLITLAHPITISPCANEATFGFFNPETNSITYRQFVCPCVAWDLTHTVHSVYLGSGDACGTSAQDPLYRAFSNENYRLWIMKHDQEPLPASITRHKVLLGSFPKNQMSENLGWPLYSIDPHSRVSKILVFKKSNGQLAAVPDRTKSTEIISYGGITNFFVSPFQGQGDDGHPAFTITQDEIPETIFMGWHQQNTEVVSKNPPTICQPSEFYSIDDGRSIQVNEECDPGVFNPNSIPGYDSTKFSTDPAESYFLMGRGGAAPDLYALTRLMLANYGKPQIVFYQFPGEILQPDIPTLAAIVDDQTQFPLEQSPYLSREAKNSIFSNSNIIAFNEQKMLQAAELNELQEKFYKNQSLTIRGYNKWLTKSNLTQNSTNIFGTNLYQSTQASTGRVSGYYDVNTTTPLDPMSVSIFPSPGNIYTVIIKPDQYRVVSSHDTVGYDPITGYVIDFNYNKNNNIDYIHILENKTISIDLTTMTDNHVCWIIVTIDTGNIINCNNYPELNDNTGGAINAPCGASRNLLRIVDSITSKLFIESALDTTSSVDVVTTQPVNNAASDIIPPKYLLAYAKKVDGVITFYHSNGIKIQ